MQASTFDSVLIAETMPEDFKNYSFTGKKIECFIRVTWRQDPNQTSITLIGGSEKKRYQVNIIFKIPSH
jgi:hypothetical protein